MEIHALSGIQNRLQYVRDSQIAIFRAFNAAMGPNDFSIIRSLGPNWNLDQTAKFTQNINTESCHESFSVFLGIKFNYTSIVPFYVNGYLVIKRTLMYIPVKPVRRMYNYLLMNVSHHHASGI